MSDGNAGPNVVLTDVSLVEAVESSVVTVTLRQLQPDELGDAMEVPVGAGLGERCRVRVMRVVCDGFEMNEVTVEVGAR